MRGRRVLFAALLALPGCGGDCEDLDDLAARVVAGAVDCGLGTDADGSTAALSAVNACVDDATTRRARYAVRYRIRGIDSALYLVLQHEADGTLHRYWTDSGLFGEGGSVERGFCAGGARAQSFSGAAVRDCDARPISQSSCD